jgi:hypothetical protein
LFFFFFFWFFCFFFVVARADLMQCHLLWGLHSAARDKVPEKSFVWGRDW